MPFVGRVSELGRLRSALDRSDPAIVRVTGLRGGGKTALVRHVLVDHDHVIHGASPLPDLAQRADLAATLTSARAARGLEPVYFPDPVPDWRAIFESALGLARDDARAFVLVIDDAHRLAEARSRFREPLARALQAARRDGQALHVVLVGASSGLPTDDGLSPFLADSIDVRPLHFRAAAQLLPGSRPEDLVRAYAVFGGIPRVLASIDRGVALGTNVRRLMLSADAILSDAGGMWLERDVQAPARYYAILSTLAGGEADWSAVHAGVPDLSRSGQVAPYLKKLEELGLVVARRSLDAHPRSRSRRYSLTDPFLAAWMRFVFPARPSLSAEAGDLFSTLVRPVLDDHVSSVFPEICRQHMAHDSIETLGASVRESGSIWGEGYDIPVAGILISGSAFYGTCHWNAPDPSERPLRTLDHQLRETRYGFGREHRLRLVFLGEPPPRWLQRTIARRHDALVVDPEMLVGEE